MAVRNGTDILIKLATSLVDGTVSQTIDLPIDMIDVTTKDSANKDKEYLAGEGGGTISVEGKWAESTSNYSVQDIVTARAARAAVAFIYGGTTTGDFVLTGSAIISGFTWAAPKNGESTWSMTLQVTGTPTASTAA